MALGRMLEQGLLAEWPLTNQIVAVAVGLVLVAILLLGGASKMQYVLFPGTASLCMVLPTVLGGGGSRRRGRAIRGSMAPRLGARR